MRNAKPMSKRGFMTDHQLMSIQTIVVHTQTHSFCTSIFFTLLFKQAAIV